MDLRPATLSDLPDIARLHEANWRRDYVDTVPGVALGAGLSAHMQTLWTGGALDKARVFVAHDGPTLLGFVTMVDLGPHDCPFVEALHVTPSASAQGVGRALMSAVAILAMPGPLTLEVLSANTDARTIYRAWGGVESEEFEDTILGYPVPAITVGWRDTTQLVNRLRGRTP